MPTTRRDFLQYSMAASAAAAIGLPKVRAAIARPRSAPQKILILGGTAFVGPACMEAALARGHKVTLFNRGVHELKRKEAGRPSLVPDGVEVLYGNRDPRLTADDWKKDPAKDGEKDPNSPKGLSQLEGKKWDAVIDTSGFFPRMVKASAELLAPNVKQYVFISSISVYKNNDKPGADESDELGHLEDASVEDFGPEFKNYGPGKAACEEAAEKAMPGRVANVRPGFIVGPRDTSARFLYWPVRAEKGGEMVVPGKPSDPIQIIDVRDLAEWIIHLIETNTNGAFNATGPEKPLTMEAMVAGCKAGAKSDVKPVWVAADFMKEQGVDPVQSCPLWLPPEGETSGFHNRSVAKAIAAGLKFRSVEDTAKASLEWYHGLPTETQSKVVRLIPPEKEASLLKAWREKDGKSETK